MYIGGRNQQSKGCKEFICVEISDMLERMVYREEGGNQYTVAYSTVTLLHPKVGTVPYCLGPPPPPLLLTINSVVAATGADALMFLGLFCTVSTIWGRGGAQDSVPRSCVAPSIFKK